MSFRFSFLLIATAIILVAGAAAQAQTKTTISLGGATAKLGDKVVDLPAPDGHEEASQWENIKTLFSAMVPANGDLLAAYLPVSDCELLRNGQRPLMPSWALINILREGRTHVSDKAEFARIIAIIQQNANALVGDPHRKDMKKHFARIDEVLSKAYSKDVKFDLSKPKNLGSFDSRPNVYSHLMLMQPMVQMDGKPVDQSPVLATMSMVLVKQRIIAVYTYKKLESKADAEALITFTTKWVNEILAAN